VEAAAQADEGGDLGMRRGDPRGEQGAETVACDGGRAEALGDPLRLVPLRAHHSTSRIASATIAGASSRWGNSPLWRGTTTT